MFTGLCDFMYKEYPGCNMVEWQGSKIRFEVPSTIGGERLKLSSMFGKLTAAKAQLGLQEYSLSQTSLEQIFNKFASTQEEETGAVKGMLNPISGGDQHLVQVNLLSLDKMAAYSDKLSSDDNGQSPT